MTRLILRKIFSSIGGRVKDPMRVVFANKSEYRNYSGNTEPRLTIVFKTRAAEWWSTVSFYQGLVECYIDGSVDIIAEHPMQTLTDIGRRAFGEGVKADRKTLADMNPVMLVRQW